MHCVSLAGASLSVCENADILAIKRTFDNALHRVKHLLLAVLIREDLVECEVDWLGFLSVGQFVDELELVGRGEPQRILDLRGDLLALLKGFLEQYDFLLGLD